MHCAHLLCVAAVLVEKILRVQPDVKRIYLPVRAADAASVKERVETEVINCCACAFLSLSPVLVLFFLFSSKKALLVLCSNEACG
jgi:hypothetical protein